ncbi:predicted protein [Streptomyces sp. AA4]|nr:predicted protein [Streptomyces sp. AA4]
MDIASLVVAAAALLVSTGSLWYARGQKKAADRSAEASERSAGSAERSERTAVVSATAAAETVSIERDRRADEKAEAMRNRVRWELNQASKHRYVLRNAEPSRHSASGSTRGPWKFATGPWATSSPTATLRNSCSSTVPATPPAPWTSSGTTSLI